MTREQRFKRLKITEKIIMWLYTTFPGSWWSLFLGLDKHTSLLDEGVEMSAYQ